MPTIRWGLIGASDIAATRVLPAIRRSGDSVEFVYSSTPSRASAFADRHGIDNPVSDLAQAYGCPAVDAVYISSTNEKHASQAIAAASARKHVLCEKPMALTLADARNMLRAADAHGVVLAVNHHLPGAGTHRAIRRMVASGAIGSPLAVRIGHTGMIPERLRGWRLRDLTSGGVILDVTVHDISAAQAILDTTAVEASAISARQGSWATPGDGGPPDAVMATLRFGNIMVQLHDAFTIAHCPSTLEVIGTEASIRGVGVMTQDPVGTLWRTVGSETEEITVPDRRDLYDIALEGFRSAVFGTGSPTVTGHEGLTALAGALAVAQAAASGQNTVVADIV